LTQWVETATTIVSNGFEVNDEIRDKEVRLEGSLIFSIVHGKDNDVVNVEIGSTEIGWISRRGLADLAQALLDIIAKIDAEDIEAEKS
jgi:hypothetical protein